MSKETIRKVEEASNLLLRKAAHNRLTHLDTERMKSNISRLISYTRHRSDCKIVTDENSWSNYECTCGLTELLREAHETN